MLDIQLSNILIALAVTTGAGLATGIGGLLVFTTRAPNARLLAFGLAFAGGAMVFVSLSEILNKSIQSFSLAYGDNLGFTCAILAFRPACCSSSGSTTWCPTRTRAWKPMTRSSANTTANTSSASAC